MNFIYTRFFKNKVTSKHYGQLGTIIRFQKDIGRIEVYPI